MDKTTASIFGVVFIVLLLLGFYAVFRLRGKFKLKGPLGLSVEAEGDNAAMRVRQVEAGRNLRLNEATGGGVDAEKLKAKGDVEISSSSPKAPPPPKV
ncbi:MAG: hypothetical protein WA117_16525 [Verrucomicrobiia bacterium]